jgi:hypothetical protein
MNNATPASVTALYFNDVDDGGRDGSFQLANMQAGDLIKIRQVHDDAKYWIGRVTGTTDNTGWWTIDVEHLFSGTLFGTTQACHTDVEFQSAQAVPSVQNKVKTANETRVSNSTYTADNHLAGFTLEAGAYYRIHAHLIYIHHPDPDAKFRFNFSNAPQTGFRRYVAGEASSLIGENFTGPYNGAMTVISAVTTDVGILIDAWVQANATTGGTLDLEWAQNTSNAQAITLRFGSFMQVEKVG